MGMHQQMDVQKEQETIPLSHLLSSREEDHPRAGLLKARLMPEDLTVNVSSKAPVSKCALPCHAWGNIVTR